MNETLENNIWNGGLAVLWNIIRAVKDDTTETQDAYLSAKHGLKYTFDISFYLNGRFELNTNHFIRIQGMVIRYEDFYDEIWDREDAIRKVLISHLLGKKTVRPRGQALGR